MEKTENELIAEFMKLDRHPNNQRAYWIEDQSCYLTFDNLQFHKSWNQLMPVVEKIRKIVERNHSKSVGPENEDMELFDKIVDNGLAWVDIDSTYKAVVEFIKWHNTQK